VTDTDSTTRVEKPWGYEDILERNQDFVIKRILLRAGNRSSLQVHERKREWVEVVDGTIELTIGTDQEQLETRILSEGDVYRVPPGTIHRVLAVDDALILEICTPGDDDIIRLEDDYGRRGQHETRATRWDRVRALWISPRDHLAAIVLILGLVLAGLLVALSNAVSLPALNVIHGDGPQLHEVGGTYVAGWDSPLFDPFHNGRLRLLTPFATLFYLASVTSLGSFVIAAVRGVEDWPRPVQILAGFLPGFLMVLGPAQLTYSVLPYVTASWVVLVGTVLTALALHRRTLASTARRVRSDAGYRDRWLRTAGWVAGLVALSALWRLQAGRNFMVTDSIIVFLNSAKAQLAGDFGRYLLQWDQQSDEWLFSAPLMFTSHASQDYLFPLWGAQFMGLASFSALVLGIVRTLAPVRKVVASWLSLGVVLAATPAVLPIFYIAIFGGSNPAWWVGHVGRYVGIVAPWVALLLVGRVSGRAAWTAVLFATVGIAFTSVHVGLYTGIALVVAWLWPHLRGRRPALLSGDRAGPAIHALAGVALAAPLVTYAVLRRVTWQDELAFVLVAGAVVATVAALVILLGTTGAGGAGPARGRLRDPAALRPALGWLGALALGYILSNNLTNGLTSGSVRSVLGAVLPGYDSNLASRGLLGPSPLDGLSFPAFSGQECWISGHCLSVGGFVGGYGFLLVLSAASWLAMGRVSGDDEGLNRRRVAWLLMVAALSISFILVDFTGANQGVAWIMTRFIEVPYYGLLVLATIVLVGSRDRLTAIAGGAVVGAWVIVPVLYNLVPLQLIKNLDWLVGLVSKP
jgi:mannose-6-phosphate isomerase-like protein (cupin superfamily)